jgi:hypothetical protein
MPENYSSLCSTRSISENKSQIIHAAERKEFFTHNNASQKQYLLISWMKESWRLERGNSFTNSKSTSASYDKQRHWRRTISQ